MATVVSSGQELEPHVFHQNTGSASFAAAQTISLLKRPCPALYHDTSVHCFNAFARYTMSDICQYERVRPLEKISPLCVASGDVLRALFRKCRRIAYSHTRFLLNYAGGELLTSNVHSKLALLPLNAAPQQLHIHSKIVPFSTPLVTNLSVASTESCTFSSSSTVTCVGAVPLPIAQKLVTTRTSRLSGGTGHWQL